MEKEEKINILITDDDSSMQKVLPLTLEKAGYESTVAKTGDEAISLIQKNTCDFDCVLLDIRMPGKNGVDVLGYLREKLPLTPVIMLTALNDLDMGIKTMRLGAYDYLVKPVRQNAFLEAVRKALEHRKLLMENERLEKENKEYRHYLECKVRERTAELSEAYQKLKHANVETVTVLAETIEAKDPYTRGHCTRVRDLSLALAQRIGIGLKDQERLEYGALLHDIGKIGIPENLLHKNGPLTEKEKVYFQQHPVIGETILKSVDFFHPIVSIVRQHHEWVGGAGYPDGLAGEDIDPLSRIVAISDAFDAMTSDRPYRRALPLEVALEELKNHKITQFDPDYVRCLITNQLYEYISKE